jgi:hypothetical protein
LENCAGWGAQSIMAELFPEGNVEKTVGRDQFFSD